VSWKEINKTYQLEPVTVGPDFAGQETTWFVRQAKAHNLRWLLAHADDGVIWGEVRGEQLALSGDVFDQISPKLQALTLQQARLFSPQAELYLWRTTEGFTARLLTDVESNESGCLEESYLLWGNRLEEEKEGFFSLREGKQGLRHAPPIEPRKKKDNEIKRLQFIVRHYLDYDDDGQAYIKVSRLVSLNNGGQNG
jgi:CRISPR-associated protein (TIGR03984 family)